MSAKAPIKLVVQQGESSSLRADFSWALVGNAAYAVGQWIRAGSIFAMLIATIVQLAGSVIILVRGTRKHAYVCAPNVEAAQPDVLLQA